MICRWVVALIDFLKINNTVVAVDDMINMLIYIHMRVCVCLCMCEIHIYIIYILVFNKIYMSKQNQLFLSSIYLVSWIIFWKRY